MNPALLELAEAEKEYRDALALETKGQVAKIKARKRLLLARAEYRESVKDLLENSQLLK